MFPEELKKIQKKGTFLEKALNINKSGGLPVFLFFVFVFSIKKYLAPVFFYEFFYFRGDITNPPVCQLQHVLGKEPHG